MLPKVKLELFILAMIILIKNNALRSLKPPRA
jgi:hypothetical protein